MGRKAAETIRNINNTFGPETTNECTVQWWVKEFCKGDKSLKDEEPGGWPSEVDSDHWSAITEADLKAAYEKLPKSSVVTILWSFGIWSWLERWKINLSRCLMSWPKIKKIVISKCRLLCYAATNHFSIVLWPEMKSGFYTTVTVSNNHLSYWTKRKLQSTFQTQTCTKKTLRHCLVVCCLSDPL